MFNPNLTLIVVLNFQLQDQHRDLVELQETNVQLQAQLHHMSNNIPLPCNHSNDQSQITCHDNNQRNNMCDELSDLENSQSQSLFHELSAVNSFHGGEVNDSQSLFDELSHFHSNQGQEQAKSHQVMNFKPITFNFKVDKVIFSYRILIAFVFRSIICNYH